MLSELRLRNFKAFGDNEQKAPMSQITLIYGPNSGGKSSIIQALLLLKQSLDSEWSRDRRELMTRGVYVNLGSFPALLHKHEIAHELGLSVTYNNPSNSRNKRAKIGVHMTFVATELDESAKTDSSILSKIEYQILDEDKALLGAELAYKFNQDSWDLSQLSIASDSSREIFSKVKTSQDAFLPAPELLIEERLQKLKPQSAQKSEQELQQQLILEPIRELIREWILDLLEFDLIQSLGLKLKREQKRFGRRLGELLGKALGQAIEQELGQEYAQKLESELVKKYKLEVESGRRREQKLNRERELAKELKDKLKLEHEFRLEWQLELENTEEQILKLEEEEREHELEELKYMRELIPEQIDEEARELVHPLIRPLIWEIIRQRQESGQEDERKLENDIIRFIYGLELEDDKKVTLEVKVEDELKDIPNMLKEDIQEIGKWKSVTKLMSKLKPKQLLDLTPSDIPQSYNNLLRSITYLGPLRSYPERLYTISGVVRDSVGTQGEFTPHILYHDSKTREKINKYFENFEIPYELKVNEFEEMQLVGKYVSITLDDKRLNTLNDKDEEIPVTVTLADVGFGINQVLPVIIEGVASPPNTIICVEQPEIHLHPRLQAELAEMIIETSEEGKQWIVETHSELLIRRIQRRIRGGKLKPNDVSVLYVDPGDDGSKIKVLELNENGDFIEEWPHGFFDEGFKELMTEE